MKSRAEYNEYTVDQPAAKGSLTAMHKTTRFFFLQPVFPPLQVQEAAFFNQPCSTASLQSTKLSSLQNPGMNVHFVPSHTVKTYQKPVPGQLETKLMGPNMRLNSGKDFLHLQDDAFACSSQLLS